MPRDSDSEVKIWAGVIELGTGEGCLHQWDGMGRRPIPETPSGHGHCCCDETP